MRFFFIFIFLIAFNIQSFSQNLVPNPSFEDTISCPIGLNQVNSLSNWFSARPSPDYFNFCGVGQAAVPQNFWGYQLPASGNGFAGLATYYGGFNTREYIGIQLSTPLILNTKYFIFAKVVLALDNSIVRCASNNFGVLFSNEYYDGINDSLKVMNFSHVNSNQVIVDTLNWTNLVFSFYPDSNYSFMYLGNFFDDTLTTIIQYGPSCAAYYYIDDLCLSTDSTYCSNLFLLDKDINVKNRDVVYPNPCLDFFQVDLKDFANLNDLSICIFRPGGDEILFNHSIQSSLLKIDCNSWESGIYFLKLIDKTNCIFFKLIVKL